MSFEWYKSIDKIKNKLDERGYTSYKQEITERELAGSMFGEILLGVCSKLMEIKIRDQQAYNEIREDAEELIEYCISNGLHPRPTNLSEN
jgi:hypothetical protein